VATKSKTVLSAKIRTGWGMKMKTNDEVAHQLSDAIREAATVQVKHSCWAVLFSYKNVATDIKIAFRDGKIIEQNAIDALESLCESLYFVLSTAEQKEELCILVIQAIIDSDDISTFTVDHWITRADSLNVDWLYYFEDPETLDKLMNHGARIAPWKKTK